MLEGISFFDDNLPFEKWLLKDDLSAKIFNIHTNDEIIYSINDNTSNIDKSCRFMLNRLLDEKGGPYCSKEEIEDMLYRNFYLMYKN